MAQLYKDSKTFVDKKLRFPPSQVLESFYQLLNQTENQPSQEDVALFVDANFDSEGLEFEPWDPSDWISDPAFLDTIVNPDLQEWGSQLHETWKFLGRKIKGTTCHSMLTKISTYFLCRCQWMCEIIQSITLWCICQIPLSFLEVGFAKCTIGIHTGSSKVSSSPK